jgi:hypothetical protein
MLAHHPVTGKEIRVIQTDASIWKEHKTLRFGKGFSVWDTVSAEWESGVVPDFFIQLEDASDAHLKMISRQVKVLLISRAVLGSRSVAEFKALQIGNVLGLEELHSIYPHLGGVWDGTVEDAAVMLAGLLRYRQLAGVWNSRAETLGLRQVVDAPSRLWWVTQYYTPPTSKRRREIQKCLEINSKSSLIDKIILLNEKAEVLPVISDKIEQRVIGKRLTYADVLRAGAEMPLDVILVFANADICIDDKTWKQLWDVNLQDKFLALLRYDVPESGSLEEAKLFGPRADSQDTWVIRVEDIVKREATICKGVDFQFGRMGCDNAVALEMLRQKFLVINPCLSLKTYHFHTSGVRNYEKTDVIERPMFHYIHPSGFHDLEPVLKLPNAKITKPAALIRPIRGPGANQWMVGANRKLGTDDTPLKLNNTNTITPFAETGLEVKNCFMTADGLVYDRDKLWIGSGVRAQKVWSTAAVNAMTPSLECKKGLCVEWAKGADESREVYILKVLSKIFRLAGPRRIVGEGYEFVCPEKKEVIEALETFDWRANKLPVIKYDPDAVIWCKEAQVATVSENTTLLSEDMEALRSALPTWSSTVKQFGGRMRIVLVEDGRVLTSEFIQQLEDVLERGWDIKVVYPGKTSAHRMFDCFNGAWGVMYGGTDGYEGCGWNWMLPKGGYAMEVAGECSQGLEVSAASGLEHRFVPKHLEKIFETVWEENQSWVASAEDENDTRPVIWMPRKDLEGYFAHPGDSFREMVRLWAKAGLCRVKEHSLATMVWWGDVGAEGVLLYDRPNHDWRLAAPLVEKSWKKALFGNPKVPSGAANCSPWFFWPRRPELVEELARATLRGWEDRKDGIVFYGKTENKVQEKRRSTADWKSACSEWVMVKGDEAYPFTQKEYLENLAKARFGLCLAGYGYKCHREVECMALGCVPVCAPEVDMDSYAVPPVEGVHYIRVSSPEDALEKISAVSEEKWVEMSAAARAWWLNVCSVEGSFALTKRLIQQ